MVAAAITLYGSWKSPISAEAIASATVGLGGITVMGEDLYWLEGRANEGGRNVLVRCTPDGTLTDITPTGFNVRTRVHEYGGGSYLIANQTIYFSNFADQRLYQQPLEAAPQALTPEGAFRYADAIFDPIRQRLICVLEDHSAGGEAVNAIAAIDLQTQTITRLASGEDFYSSPRLSTDGQFLAWLSWNHPNMPWDGTILWQAKIKADGSLDTPERIAGGVDESIFQPEWSPTGELYFVSDRTNWWNLYRYDSQTKIQAVCPKEAEFGLPQWVFGLSTYCFASPTEIICTYTQAGNWYLASLDLETQQLTDIPTPYTNITSPVVAHGKVYFLAGSPTQPGALVELDLTTHQIHTLRRSSALEFDPGYLSVPQSIEFPTEHNLTAYGFFYPPQNKDYQAPAGEKPPLLVKSHGGPTAATSSSFNLKIQYWTSRGFAVLDVNYGGSTGYGREYRQRLKESWGIVDVDDCSNGAKYLAEQGLVDPNRLAIAGGSAGGYTTLAALAFRDVFKAGASHYGVSDLEALATDTHKFESRYLDSLIGKYPEQEDVYKARSPIHHTDRLSCPIIFFQGLEDKVVPPNQAEMMVEALKTKGLPVAYVPFEGEQHGFRKAENIKRALDGEFYFYARVFGFEPADPIEAVAIANLVAIHG